MKSNILWFERPLKGEVAEIRFNDEGLISFNPAAQKVFPEYVKFGFCPDLRKMYIAESTGKRGMHVTSTPKALKALTVKMYDCKIPFPCVFVFENKVERADVWEGSMVDSIEQELIREIKKTASKSAFTARNSDAMQQLLKKYSQQIKYQCTVYAKTIPREDRLSTAQEGFMQAVLLYKPNLQYFSTFAMDFVKEYIKSKISQYSDAYKEMYSLYRTAEDGSEYEVFDDKQAVDNIENMLFNVDIREKASPMAYDMAVKLSEGYTKEDIMDEMKISSKKYEMLFNELYELLNDIYPDMK